MQGQTPSYEPSCVVARKTSAALVSYCDGGSNDICYSWGVPESTASSGSGKIFFQIEVPTDYQWVALGTGSGMDGSTMFIVYQDGSGNITLSTRMGHGHDMPEYSHMSAIKLLNGSGVCNKMMTANIQWGDLSGMDFAGSNAWISAWKRGSPMDSTDSRASFNEHDDTDSFSVNFAKATISSDSNPFTKAPGTQPKSGSTGDAVSGGGGGEDHTVAIHGIIMSVVFLIVAFAGMWIGFGVGKIAADRDVVL
ncbi:uncharacterized protein FRV6_16645 [Fusarium oxysporum]|uniref:DOMON domain-containing protein n=1 Tax=Fusarium oxysporum TaxID=5507 RepID=A0A2H3TV89_FUSOX|nr:uncharacterized protein FRV6_16645 [Fusarium oxysporum]